MAPHIPHIFKNGVEYKHCRGCNMDKTLDKFNKNKTSPCGKYSMCRDCQKLNWKRFQEKNGSRGEYHKKWREKNPTYMNDYKRSEKGLQQENSRKRRKYATDTQYNLKCKYRARIHAALKGLGKTGSSKDLLGCTLECFKKHLESQFTEGMSWENMGKGDDKWEIDHIIPVSVFDLNKEQKIAFWYKNCQPLWYPEHKIKGVKYKEEDKLKLINEYLNSV